ncbi:hypothetical protein [Bradyrhizobium sp. SZCCHNRI1073]|uniref:hypothetical protein n=1 Tax=Bradyrhizobium sp. SZCCHNRI1073 TaxID=3057280 RepID=UPI002917124E|nr:hypothetical protein [Bradyrhizobium sp. SZCCHNRI1073]
MFKQLAILPFEIQKEVAVQAWQAYAPIWVAKHPGVEFGKWIAELAETNLLGTPESRQMDPADAEFENAILQFTDAQDGESHLQRTAHLASSIRSSVLARQIDRWLRDFPEQYTSWHQGEHFAGPTFLDDDGASLEAEKAWKKIDAILRSKRKSKIRESMEKIERAYFEWESSLL